MFELFTPKLWGIDSQFDEHMLFFSKGWGKTFHHTIVVVSSKKKNTKLSEWSDCRYVKNHHLLLKATLKSAVVVHPPPKKNQPLNSNGKKSGPKNSPKVFVADFWGLKKPGPFLVKETEIQIWQIFITQSFDG